MISAMLHCRNMRPGILGWHMGRPPLWRHVSEGDATISLNGDKMIYVLQMNFPKASNKVAEYEGLLHGMRMAKACGATRLMIYGDSNLIVQ